MKHFISSLSVINANTPPCEGRVSSRKILSLLLILFLSIGNAWAESETMATWTFSSSSYPGNKTNYEATSGTCKTSSTFYLNGTGSTWNTSKGYAFTAVTDITITIKLSKAISAGTPLTFSADMFYNKASNAPMTGFDLSVSANGSAYSTTGLSATSISLSNSSANKAVKYTTQNALAKDATIQLKYTGKGKAGAGQGYFGNIKVIAEIASGGETPEPTPTKLSAPANLKEASITETSATLSWDAVANANNYSVTINGNTSTANTNSYNATGLTAGTEYTWSVVAKGDGTNYADSDAAQHTFTTTATTPDPEPGTGTNVTYDFTKIDGFSEWPTAYASGKGDVAYTEATVKFTGAVKQTTTITDCPVTKGGEVQLVLNSGYSDRDIKNVTFVCKQWGSKTQTITLHYSTDGGATYTSTEITSTNFEISSDNLPEGTNAVKITFSSTSNQVGIASVTFSLSGSEEPTDCTPLTPTLSYESTTLLTSTTSSAPTLDGNTGEGTVTYTSSNTEVATVDAETGVITAVNAGTTTITATIAATGEYCEGKATANITVKQLVSCADIYNLEDEATFVLKDFDVTYVNGKYTYIKDDNGYGLIYKESYGLNAGDQVASGKFEGKRTSYSGLVEIIPTTTAADLNATSGTAPEPEVMTNTPTNADINKYVKFEDVTFASTGFSSKKVTGTINAGDITFYDQFVTSATFNTSKKYNVIGAVSIYNSTVQVNFISAEEVAEPTLNLTTTPIDFGKVAINSTNESTLQLSGSLLTKDITLSVEGDSYFTVSANSITPSEESVNETITITYKPTVEGTHTATLKITSDELEEQTITLEGQAAQQHTVHFYVNGEEQTELAKTILSGNTLDALPEEPESCDPLTYPTFAGWTTPEIVGTTDTKPTMLDLSTPITSDCNYYAVFEKGTTSSGSTTSAIMKYTGGTTTNMKDGNNATIVGLDETLFNITSTKTASGTHVGLNKDNDIRLYANKNDGNGNILMISMLDGSSITKITLNIKQEATFVVKANGKSITGADNVYTIDYPSCSIQNTTTGVTTQLHLNSITIEYTTSTTTYEYITSCAVVVPTCEIIYDYADGEGECTTDIVEKDTEYTLCATAPTKAGHTFLNWKDQNGVEYAKGATINSVTEDLTLTAQWQVNSYEVTWMSLGEEVTSNSANHNTQPTKPANPTYTCGTGKEFIGWTTQEIDGVGVPANLYTDEFPVVTKAITYYAVFASINSSTESTTHTLTPNNSWSGYKEGTITDDKGYTWSYCAAGTKTDGVCSLNLRNKDTETSYIGSPSFAANVKSIKATIVNGSASKARKVYVCSAPTLEPTTGDLGITEVAGGHSGELSLAFEGTISLFYLQVSDALQFQSIVVEVGADPYTDYTTSCPDPVALGEGDNSEIINAGGTIDVKVNRNFVANTLYTLSLPFAMDNVADIFGAGTILYKYSSLTMVEGELEIGFDKVNSIEAGTPYLIEPAQAVDGFTAEDVKITNTQTPITFAADGNTLTMKPVLTATTGAKTNGEYWLASNRYLYNTQTNLLSLRAVFELVVPIGSAVPRARVVFNQNTATGMENVDASAQPVKMIINGQLYILRGEKMYDAQGKLVK